MSFAELKEKVYTLTAEERLELEHILLQIALQNDPEYLAEMNRRMARMDAGEKITEEEVMRRHRELLAQGR